MKTTRLINIFIVVFIDLLGSSLILPLLPYYAENFGANPTVIGLLTASYAAASLLGASLMGRLSDRFGRRPILLLSVGGTFAGFLFLGFAEPIGRGLASLFASASVNAFIIYHPGVSIRSGDLSQVGWYGSQSGDHPASIAREI